MVIKNVSVEEQLHEAALMSLCSSACEIDAQMAVLMRHHGTGEGATSVVASVLCRLAAEKWRRPNGDTIAHVVIDSRRKQHLDEAQAVELSLLILIQDPTLISTDNSQQRSPADIAMLCEGDTDIQRIWTVRDARAL